MPGLLRDVPEICPECGQKDAQDYQVCAMSTSYRTNLTSALIAGVMGADTPVALHYTYCTATPSAISSFCS